MVRQKCRNILCKVVLAENGRNYKLDERGVYSAVKNEVRTLHGDYATASLVNLSVRYIDNIWGVVLIRCPRSVHKMVQSSITFIKKIGQVEAFLQTIHVGGTIRSSLKFLIRYHKSQLPKLLMECQTEDEKQKVQAAIVKSCKESTHVMSTWERRERSETPKT